MARSSKQPAHEMPRPPRNRGLDAVCVVALVAAPAWLFQYSPVDASPWAIAMAGVFFVLCLAVSLVFHELGHLLAGELLGWHWEVFKAGPLLVERTERAVSVRLSRDARYRGAGLVVSRVREGTRAASTDDALFLLGGPGMNLLVSIATIAWWRLAGAPYLQMAAGLMALASTLTLVTTLLPVTSSGHSSDGAKALRLLWPRTVANRENATNA